MLSPGEHPHTSVTSFYPSPLSHHDKLLFGRQRQTLSSLHAPDYGSENEHSASPLPRRGTNSLTISVAVILKYAGTMPPILLVVGGAKAELAQALVPCETGAM